tara:strand:+ start:829 stop:2034 length:1206 start_codon:yes stop_codon:yes gene_type:complete
VRKTVIQNGWSTRSLHRTLENDYDELVDECWSEFEDERLVQAVKLYGDSNWANISKCVPGRSAKQCSERYHNYVKPHTTGSWSNQEDECLLHAVEIHGTRYWKKIAEHVPGRNGKQCRERYVNQLDPNLNKDKFTDVEDAIILREYNKIGPRWSVIARLLSNRSENDIKNRAAVTFLPKRQCRHIAPNAIPQQQAVAEPRDSAQTQNASPTHIDDAVTKSMGKNAPLSIHVATTDIDVPTVQLDNSVENVDFFSAMVELGALPHSIQSVTWEPPSPDSLEAHLLSHSQKDASGEKPLKHINLDDLDESISLTDSKTSRYKSTKDFNVNICSNPGEKTKALPLFATSILPVGREPEGELFMMEHKCMAINRLINTPHALSGSFLDNRVPELTFNESVVVHIS